ncbi:lysosomal acid glucosylceramidase-like isoform X2 [Daktulosphaira vitifoliae]|uniref:lysosomal acid glucosylceramidase-like isoform X2 n=1 Tax=Daktulosphaira vitifoliae TaxID=58002 RepID=UPI0021A9B5C6|nr:lysosomal acid glucosylceramidase-like isoform X2 [Daktulosphaira vitifoliae]
MALLIFFLLCVSLAASDLNASQCYQKQFSYGIVCVCNSTHCDFTPQPKKLPNGKYILYTSSNEGSRFTKSNGSFVPFIDSQWTSNEINVDENTSYQTIEGFGAAFTDSAGLNIKSLSNKTQENLLRSYFGDDGIKYNIGRVPIGGSDFSTRAYTYADEKGSSDLANFSLQTEDLEFKIPFIRIAQSKTSEELKLIASSWSAPIWMKTNNAISGIGFLKTKYMELWAKYHLKFLDAYKNFNITFWALTTGNEPLNGIIPLNRFNSMGWTPQSHRDWIGQYMGPILKSSEYNKTLLFAIDDQRIVLPWWMKMLMSDKEAAKYIDGVAVHWYLDFIVPVNVLSEVHDSFSNILILNTEASQGDRPWDFVKVQLGSWNRAEKYADNIIDDLNHWVQGWLEWNLALDTTGGPNWASNYVDAPIIVNKNKDEFYKQPMYYTIGHFSKFITRGSVRIKLSLSSAIKSVGFKRPDGAIVIVLYNRRSKNINVLIKDSKRGNIGLSLQKQSINTLIYW